MIKLYNVKPDFSHLPLASISIHVARDVDYLTYQKYDDYVRNIVRGILILEILLIKVVENDKGSRSRAFFV